MTSWAVSSILLYALLMLIAGILGFALAASRASLVAGGGSSAVLLACYWVARREPAKGLGLAAAVALVLVAVFALRLAKTRKFMPSGMLLVLSVLATGLFALGALG